MSYRPFSSIELAPPDPILGLTETFNKDSNPNKVNLCVGVYKNEDGVNPVLKSVKQAERLWLEKETTKNYLGIAGEAAYGQGVQALLFGEGHEILSSGRAATLHSPGGTGALRVGAEFLHTQFPNASIWVSDPTWANHKGIFNNGGMQVKTYPYYDAESHGLNFEAMLDALEKIPEGDAVLLHGRCHNPTGVDPTPEQWEKIVEVFQRRPIMPFLDFAYQGFGTGLEEDASAIRLFAASGVEMVVSSSFSKNMGLYRERAGALTLVSANAEVNTKVMSQVKLTVRANYSNPPSHGGQIVRTVLAEPELRDLWRQEVTTMRERIFQMRKLFVETMKAKGVQRNFDFLLEQKGMFSFSGIQKAEVQQLQDRFGIYMTATGRINVAAMTPGNMDYLCASIAEVLGQ